MSPQMQMQTVSLPSPIMTLSNFYCMFGTIKTRCIKILVNVQQGTVIHWWTRQTNRYYPCLSSKIPYSLFFIYGYKHIRQYHFCLIWPLPAYILWVKICCDNAFISICVYVWIYKLMHISIYTHLMEWVDCQISLINVGIVE